MYPGHALPGTAGHEGERHSPAAAGRTERPPHPDDRRGAAGPGRGLAPARTGGGSALLRGDSGHTGKRTG